MCRASLGYTPSGQTVTVQNAASGYSGSSSYACNNGSWTSVAGTQTCVPTTPPAPKTCEIVDGVPTLYMIFNGKRGNSYATLSSIDSVYTADTFFFAKTSQESNYTEFASGKAAFEHGNVQGGTIIYRYRYNIINPNHNHLFAMANVYGTSRATVKVCNKNMSAAEMYAASDSYMGDYNKSYAPFSEAYLKSQFSLNSSYTNDSYPHFERSPDTVTYEFSGGKLYFIATFQGLSSPTPSNGGGNDGGG